MDPPHPHGPMELGCAGCSYLKGPGQTVDPAEGMEPVTTSGQTGHELPEHVRELGARGLGLAVAPLVRGPSDDWKRDVDRWLLDVRALELLDQVRVVAQLRSFGDAPERGITPLREAALAQIQSRQAEKLSEDAKWLGWVGIAVAAVGLLLAAAQVGLAMGALGN